MIATSTRVNVEARSKPPAKQDSTVVFISKGAQAADGAMAAALAGEEISKSAARLLSAKVSRGKAREVVFDLYENHGVIVKVFLVGLGDAGQLSLEILRQSAGAAMRALVKHRIKHAT